MDNGEWESKKGKIIRWEIKRKRREEKKLRTFRETKET